MRGHVAGQLRTSGHLAGIVDSESVTFGATQGSEVRHYAVAVQEGANGGDAAPGRGEEMLPSLDEQVFNS